MAPSGRRAATSLLAPHIGVGAAGITRAANGSVILAAGQKAEITGRLEGIRLEVRSPADSATNLGQLQGDAVGIFAGTLRHSGAIVARTACRDGGRVVINAGSQAVLDPASRVDADAGERGKGGSITIWSDGSTRALGSLTARGGTLSGDGGFIETSGRTFLRSAACPILPRGPGAAAHG